MVQRKKEEFASEIGPEPAAPPEVAPVAYDTVASQTVMAVPRGLRPELLHAALSIAQAQFPTIPKNCTAKIPGKDGKPGYSYAYADLADVMSAIQPALSRNGLAIYHYQGYCHWHDRESILGLYSVLAHKSGERIESFSPFGEARTLQQRGAEITYLKRYAIGCLTNCVTDEDVDGPPEDDRPKETTRRESIQGKGKHEAAKSEPAVANGSDPKEHEEDLLEKATTAIVGSPQSPAPEKVKDLLMSWFPTPPTSYRAARESVRAFLANIQGAAHHVKASDLVNDGLGRMREIVAEREATEAGI